MRRRQFRCFYKKDRQRGVRAEDCTPMYSTQAVGDLFQDNSWRLHLCGLDARPFLFLQAPYEQNHHSQTGGTQELYGHDWLRLSHAIPL